MSIDCVSLCHTEGELYICRAQKPSGPNLLDEPWKDFIVKLNHPMGSHDLRLFRITTHSESVQPLQSVKLVYQPCSRTWAALDPYGIEITINLLVLAIYYSLYMIMCLLWEHQQLVATQLLKIWSIKSYMQLNLCLSLLRFMNPMLHLLSTFVLTLAFPHTSGWTLECSNSHYYYCFPEEY
jgi:hypothetical protein